MENEENFNWLEIYMDMQEGKDIKNSPAFKLLNSNNIDTNELTKTEKDKDAGTVELNYKDEKEKETDSISFSKGLLAFIADMPEETMKALMLAFLNGTDVAANVVGVAFNAMTNVDPEVGLAFQEGNPEKFKKLVNKNIQDFSKYLDTQKKEVKEIGEGSELNSKAAQWVSMVTQDTPYSLPIYKKLTSLGMPKYMALPVAYGIGSGVAFDDDAQIFLNSEQVQSFKEMIGALPNSSEEKIFNTTYRTLEGTALGFAIPYVFQGLKFAKNTVPKFMKPQSTIAVGAAAATGAVVDTATANETNNFDITKEPELVLVENYGPEGIKLEKMIKSDAIKYGLNIVSDSTANETNNFDPKVVSKLTNVYEGERIQSVIDGLSKGLPDSELLGFLEGEFEPSDLDVIKKELGVVKKDPVTEQDMQNMITKAEKADDQILFFDGDRESGIDEPINDYIKITDPKALEGADIVFYDDETMEQMTYQKVNENDDNWIILNEDRKTSYNQ